MIGLSFLFPTGRYHATPWGRHVNEAALAWPPEPLRILRALIACHHRKADKDRFTHDALASLIDSLSEELPIYRLPAAVHAHTRHYMPINGKNPSLVFDAFARLDPADPLIAGWPGMVLTREQREHLEHLADRLGYLGRAESLAEASLIDWNGKDANAVPLDADNSAQVANGPDHRLCRLYAALTPRSYAQSRERLMQDERERRSAGRAGTSNRRGEALDRHMKDFLATLPERLSAALAVDTSELHAVGWSGPPAAREVLYSAPEPTTAWLGGRPRHGTIRQPNPTVARFVLAGRPRPRVEDTVRIAELMRLAAMAKFGWQTTEGERRPNAPGVISGYGEDGKPMRDADHAHAFWLPEDADADGEIDHLVVYAAAGLDEECRRQLDRITRLWVEQRSRGGEGEESAQASRTEWRLALEGFGQPSEFASVSPILGSSRRWTSVTPYLMPWHPKKAFGWTDQIARELSERGIPEISEMPQEPGSLAIRGRERRPIHFHRFRSRRGLHQPDTLGRFVELVFTQEIRGPLSLGFGCHFGLGLFVPWS